MEINQINWMAFDEGWKAWDVFHDNNWTSSTDNPYEPGSLAWKSWNRGWNTNPNGIK